MKIKIDDITINTKYIAFIDQSADIYNFDDGNMPGVIIELSTGRVLEYTGYKADEVRAILCQSYVSKKKKAIDEVAFFCRLNNSTLPIIQGWSDSKLFDWLEDRGYRWKDGIWDFC